MKKALALTLTFAALLTAGCPMKPPAMKNPAAEQAALQVAQEWVKMPDEGRHGESWDAMGAYIRTVMPRDRWIENITPIRSAMGAMKGRVIESQQYSTALPQFPDGEYVVINFNTHFEHKKKGGETVLVGLEADGEWRVCGYFVR